MFEGRLEEKRKSTGKVFGCCEGGRTERMKEWGEMEAGD